MYRDIKNVISADIENILGSLCEMTIAKEVAAIKVLWSMVAHLWSVSSSSRLYCGHILEFHAHNQPKHAQPGEETNKSDLIFHFLPLVRQRVLELLKNTNHLAQNKPKNLLDELAE